MYGYVTVSRKPCVALNMTLQNSTKDIIGGVHSEIVVVVRERPEFKF